jgi:hypothetical protein
MRAFAASAQIFTAARDVHAADPAAARRDEEDIALGCECANPALQIEVWRHEAAAQPQIVTVPVLQAVPA